MSRADERHTGTTLFKAPREVRHHLPVVCIGGRVHERDVRAAGQRRQQRVRVASGDVSCCPRARHVRRDDERQTRGLVEAAGNVGVRFRNAPTLFREVEIESDEPRPGLDHRSRTAKRAADRARQAKRVVQLGTIAKLTLRVGDFGRQSLGGRHQGQPFGPVENEWDICNGGDVLDLRIPFAAVEDRPASD